MEYLDNLGELSKNYFKNRGFVTRETQQSLLNPNFETDLHDPFDFVDMGKVVNRIKLALDNNEKILVYTDYDCDGIPAGTILHDFFKKLESSKRQKDKDFTVCFDNYIPHRHKEGYGLHVHAIDEYIKKGFTLMITADLGITNIKEVAFAEENGMNVILTDHHLPLHKKREEKKDKEIKSYKETEINENKLIDLVEDLPQAYALINCQVKRETYKNKGLCGAGTAWKLCNAFLVKYREEYGIHVGWEKWLLDMVALATVADMMPLTGENRALVHYGLKVLQKSPRPGLQKLLSLAKEKQSDITEKTLSFTIAPRVNAASRLDHPMKSFFMLSGANKTIAETMGYAEELEIINKNRKGLVEDISKYVSGNIEKYEGEHIVFAGNKDWPLGVAGLIATKLVELTGKTSFVWGLDEQGVVKGSSRSGLDKISVMDLTASISDKLIHFGGHEAAGGFAFIDGKQEEVEKLLNQNYKKLFLDNKENSKTKIKNKVRDISKEVIKKESEKSKEGSKKNIVENNASEIKFDFEYKGENLYKLYQEQVKLSPFGMGNNAPVFKLVGEGSVREFGENNKHIEVSVKIIEGSHLGQVQIIKWNADKKLKDKLKNNISTKKIFYANLEKDNWKNAHRFMLIDCE